VCGSKGDGVIVPIAGKAVIIVEVVEVVKEDVEVVEILKKHIILQITPQTTIQIQNNI
jgi:hypothetical protein